MGESQQRSVGIGVKPWQPLWITTFLLRKTTETTRHCELDRGPPGYAELPIMN